MTDKPELLPYGRQAVDDDDIAAVTDVLRSDFLTTGPAVDAFEAALAEQTGAAHAIACSSGTAALHIAALALGLKAGDWAVVPAITFVGTANAIRFTGADVIFCDVDPATGLMTAETFEAVLAANPDKRVRAVLPVHLGGQPADPAGIATVARAHNIAVIEDACHALGTSYSGDKGADLIAVGGGVHSDMATFSFHPVKTVTSGEGGAVTTMDAETARLLRLARNHGMTRTESEFKNGDMAFDATGAPNPWYYEMATPGYNYRLSDIHAALGASQLNKISRFAEARRHIVARYDDRLAALAPNLCPVGRVPGCTVAWHLYQVRVDFDALGMTRADIMNALRDRGIGTQVHYIPVSSQPYYRRLYGDAALPGAEAYYARTLSLPLFPAMTDDDVERVATVLEDVLGNPAS